MTSRFREQESHATELDVEFREYAASRVQQLEQLSGFFAEALPVVENTDVVNQRLSEAGRPDLAIDGPAQMMEIRHPREIPNCNNFSPNFYFCTGRRETGRHNFRGEPVYEPIPATIDEVLALRDMPIPRSFEEVSELVESGRFPALSTNGGHATEPAFIRMLILFPEFSSRLAVEISQPEVKYMYDKFEEYLYVAYQLMSRLVDKLDPHVLNSKGDVEAGHLCK